MHSEGATDKTLAEKFKINIRTVWKWRSKHGIGPNTPIGEYSPRKLKGKEHLVRELYESGLSDDRISQELGVVPSAITKHRHKNGMIEIKHVNVAYKTKGRERELESLHAAGWSDQRIADKLDVTKYTIYKYRKSRGLLTNNPQFWSREKKAATSQEAIAI